MRKKTPMSISELITDIMSKKLIKLNADSSAFEVARMMSEYKVSSVFLTDGHDKIIGIMTERDLVREICAKDLLSSKTPVISVMSKLLSLITIGKNSSIEEAAAMMIKNGVRHLPVVAEDKKNANDIIGMISTTDIAKHLKEKLEGSSSEKSSRLLLLDSLCSGEQPIEEAIFDNE
jgi:CBS domain-containing protein